jgi:hypothetical protein
MKGYIAELNAGVVEHRAQDDAVKQAAAERDRLNSLDGKLQRLLGAIPPEVQDAGLSIVEVQRMLRPPGAGRSCCNAGQLGDALRRQGFVRERRWRDGGASFRALWRKRLVKPPPHRSAGQAAARPSTLIDDLITRLKNTDSASLGAS